MQSYFEYSTEVKEALDAGKPVLALESTIISHGMPYPQNVETTRAVEKIARAVGVVPATIAIINGKIKIGLTREELELFAQDKAVTKASCRDLAYILAEKKSAGTTVAATLYCAAQAGIKFFATGGIGGVHRGNDQDISADLIELARTRVVVICAGAKAILDLPKTLEFLETMSVPVVGYKTTFLPAFYTDKTNYSLPASVDNVAALATMVKIHWDLGLKSGILITNPIPKEYSIAAEVIDPVIANAIDKAEKNNIKGKAITPFLLSEVSQLTKGKSLEANIALIKNNVKLGAELAKQYMVGVS